MQQIKNKLQNFRSKLSHPTDLREMEKSLQCLACQHKESYFGRLQVQVHQINNGFLCEVI